MKHNLICALFFAPLIACSTSSSQAPKIGVVNVQKTLSETQEGKKALDDLKKLVEVKKADYAKKQAELIKDKKKSAKTKTEELLNLSNQAQDDLNKAQKQLNDAIWQKFIGIMKHIAETGKYDLVLNDANANIVYNGKALDLGPQLLSEYDETYPLK